MNGMNRLPAMWKVQLLTAMALAFFLAYIDEGYYDFRWMSEPENWIAIFLYVALFWAMQAVLSVFFGLVVKGPYRHWLSTFGGSLIGLVFICYIVFILI